MGPVAGPQVQHTTRCRGTGEPLAGGGGNRHSSAVEDEHSPLFVQVTLCNFIRPYVTPDVKALVLSGGVALNARLNSKVQATFGLPVHVPPEPGDEGNGVGWAWLLQAASVEPGRPFTGLPLLDLPLLPTFVAQRHAVEAHPATVAAALTKGDVVALVRGRWAISRGRGLGHRNVIAATHVQGMAAKLRTMARLQWFRYVAEGLVWSGMPPPNPLPG